MTQTNLRAVNLCNANLGRDNLGGATILNGADLTDASVVGTIFDGAEYDEHTRLPNGLSLDRE